MDFRILGPLEVEQEDGLLGLGGRKQRALLAMLLLHANEVVSRDRLIDELWGDSPPETAQNALQVHVSHLRRVLGPDRIETCPPGYRLRVESNELDADRFEHLVSEAHTAPAADAAERLRLALAIWRGPALADLDDMLARPERVRLDEERMSALELRIAADLDLGRHEELVPELEGLVREYPLRERLCGQLMVALYRSGRQADALEVYGQGRRTLDEELGLQPGEELRRLERAILEQDPALASPVASGVTLHSEERRVRFLRRSRLIAALGALILAAAVAALVVALTRPGASEIAVLPDSVAVIDPETSRVVADVAVGARPIAVAVGEGGVWVANADDGTVSRIDPETLKVAKTIGIGSPASDIAVGSGSVWVANGSEGTVTRIDSRTNVVLSTTDLSGTDELTPAGAYSVAVGYGGVWVGSGQGKVIRLDPATGDFVTSVPIGQTPTDVATGEGAVWVTTLEGRTIRIEPRTNAVTAAAFAPSFPFPLSIAAGGGAVWVGQPGERAGTVWRIDPTTVSATGTTAVFALPRGIATAPSAVWIAGGTAGTVVKIDTGTGRVLGTIRLGNAPLDVAADRRRVWVTVGVVQAST